MELLAPAGDWAALAAALEAGASAVYAGLKALNARRGAANLTQEELVRAAALARSKGRRLYLALNTDVAQRELGLALRMLAAAADAGAHAVLVKDPALIEAAALEPRLELHFSTQTGLTSSADVAAARELGASRAVLARELSLAEVAAASAVPGIGTEAFCQGALCFSVSGRCLLSSWAGGHSGNRGACASPCRLPWTADGAPAGTPLSMKDLCAAPRARELEAAGVACLKIEGRLKTAAWVRAAVELWRRVLAGEDAAALEAASGRLAAYAGRELTCGYLDGELDGLAGSSPGRPPANGEGSSIAREDTAGREAVGESAGAGVRPEGCSLTVAAAGSTAACRLEKGGRSVEWTAHLPGVRDEGRAVRLGDALSRLDALPVQGLKPLAWSCDRPDLLVPPRAANALAGGVTAALHRLRKGAGKVQARAEFPPRLREFLKPGPPSVENTLRLGDPPDRARLEAGAARAFLSGLRERRARRLPDAVVAEVSGPAEVSGLPRPGPGGRPEWIAALPAVFFEAEVAGVREAVRAAAGRGMTVEVNSWGGWLLAREAGARMEAGPGLAVLNSLAARALARRGVACVTYSIEADRRKLEELSAACPAPASMVVFGRPALMTARAKLAPVLLGKVFRDRRETAMLGRIERGLTVFRPVEPFDLRGVRDPRIRARHLVMDLLGSPDPAADWLGPPRRGKACGFNFGRLLA